jgi:cation diffusion facilitator family transporter
VGVVLMAVKFVAYWLTGSAAVLSDALESIVNVFASGFALFSIVLSARPPDSSHPYGHGRVEFFSAGLEGMLIVAAAVAIVWHAVPRLFAPQAISQLSQGIVLVAAAGAANALTGWYMQHVGRRIQSLALIADGKHLLSDSCTSAGILVGMLLVWLTGWYVLDAIVALGVAASILIMGTRLLREAVARLMDEADPSVLEHLVETLQARRQVPWIDVHCLRAWRSGARLHVDFHLTLPRYWNLQHCHEIIEEVEQVIHQSQPEPGDVIIHLDPCQPKDCVSCCMAPCSLRSTDFQRTRSWTVASAVDGPMANEA